MAHRNKEFEECIAACGECHENCSKNLAHCLQKGGRHVEPEHHLLLMIDCAEICLTSVGFMSRGSARGTEICELCAEICDACAASCDPIGDAEMRACAEVCRRWAQSCRQMAGVAA